MRVQPKAAHFTRKLVYPDDFDLVEDGTDEAQSYRTANVRVPRFADQPNAAAMLKQIFECLPDVIDLVKELDAENQENFQEAWMSYERRGKK